MSDLKHLSVQYNNAPCYDIAIGKCGSFICEELTGFSLSNRKVAIVTDSNVAKYHARELAQSVSECASKVVTFTFQAGEEQKNLATVEKLYEFLIQNSFDRNDVLLALGGGVVGDMTGFTAATYLRGIRFFQIPTSLLAMVDSSIGGKTGVDFGAYKNMVGAFYMPSGVYMNLSTLVTLPEKEYLSGMGEIIKHGLIKDAAYYEWIEASATAIRNRCIEQITKMIYRSCEIKREVVENDPKEVGERALLNFGHSIGHAVEKLMDFSLLHGECVAIGMVGASYISKQRGYISKHQLDSVIHILELFHLPTTINDLSTEEILQVMSKDKKVDAGKIKFILLKSIGNAFIDTTVSNDEIREAIGFIKSKDR